MTGLIPSSPVGASDGRAEAIRAQWILRETPIEPLQWLLSSAVDIRAQSSYALPNTRGETRPMPDSISADVASSALLYHRLPRPGKLEITATKPLGTQHDLSLAYSPGVAAACLAIAIVKAI